MTFDLGGRKVADLPLAYTIDVDAWSGVATMRVVVPTSSGRDARGPALSLVYSSGGGGSELGVGWSLAGIPAIGIDTRERAPRWDGGDGYELAGSQLVPWLEQTSAGWRPRTRTAGPYTVIYYRSRLGGAKVRVEKWVETATGRLHFRTRDARNVVTIYGARPAAAARIADPDDETRTFTWLPEIQIDPSGSAMWLEYVAETLDGVDRAAPYEPRRPTLAKRYLKRIRYSNAAPFEIDDAVIAGQLPGSLRWCFETVFDYGDHSGEVPGIAPDRAWPARLDPTTNTRCGFPVRTYRLCRRILTFHAFDELGATPVLVGVLGLQHDEAIAGSTLRQIDYTGYRRDGATLTSAAVPPLVMSYAPAAIEPGFQDAPITTAENIPAGLASRRTSFVDLFGEGLPGILTETERAWHYKQNLGGGQYAAETVVFERPAVRAGAGSLGDLDADGDTDLAQLGGRFAGRFVLDRETRTWQPFAPFVAFPHVEALGTRARWVDLNCDGRLDVVIPKHDSLVWFASRGDGFEPPIEVPLPPGFEPTLDADPELDLFFADMNGDGMPDLVRVRNGSVEYWPSLGNGRFGDLVVMDGAPPLARAGDFDASRLRFVDLDGSGTSDLVYLDRGEVSCWINASGNQLVEGARLTGMPYLDNTSNVQVIDFLGEGRPCLVWSTPLPGRASPIEYIPLTPSVRPRLLLSVDDSRGCEWRLTYSSSATHYLRDRADGRPWQTTLPAHYSVVDRRETIDQIGNTRSVRRYAYHDGFYDGANRERRGFGHVDIFDEDILQAQPDVGAPAVSPGSLTRLWFHSGTPMWGVDAAMYSADRELALLPPHMIVDDVPVAWSEAEQGLRALAGLVIRRENWSYDAQTGAMGEHPVDVEQTSFRLRCIQPSLDADHPAAFSSVKCEDLTATYEERPADPRVRHVLLVEVDAFEQPVRDVDVGYARRATSPRDIAAQGRHHVLVHDHHLVSIDEDDRFELGIPIEAKSYELGGVRPGPAGVMTRAQLAEPAIAAALASSNAHESVLTDDPALGPQARLISWDRGVYWNDDRSAPLAPGHLGRITLIHHEETACFSPGFVDSVFGTRVDDARLQSLGYGFADGLWWARGDIHTFAPAEGFFQRVGLERADGARVAYEYDASCLEIVAVTDPLGHRTTATYDYQTLLATSCIDANGTISEVRLDPLGVAVATTRRGHVDAQPWGFEPIAALAPVTAASLDAVLADPGAVVQQGSRATWYDLDAWRRDHQPPVIVVVDRETLVHDGAGGSDALGSTTIAVAHLDGLRRVLQEKTTAGPGPAVQRDAHGQIVVDAGGMPVLAQATQRWRSTGHVVYDAKQRPSWVFDPFFTTTHAYEGDDVLEKLGVATTNHYDAKGRLAGQDLPDGTYTRVTYGPWTIDREDPNDTVLDSAYRALREGLPATDPRKQALEHAKLHANTSHTRYLDPFGRDTGSLARGGSTAEDRRSELVLRTEGPIATITDPRGLVAFAYQHDMRGRRLFEHSVDAGDRRSLVDAYGRIRWLWNPRGLVVERGFDLADRPTFTHVTGGDGPSALDHRVEEWQYAETLAPAAAAAANLVGRAIAVRDSSGEGTIDRCDPDGRVLSASRKLRAQIDNTPDWRDTVALDPEVFATTARYDALGRVLVEQLPDGSTREHGYLPGGSRISTRITTSDGKLTDVTVLADASLDARGQRERVVLGNGATISYTYDPHTSRLQHQTASFGTRTLQDLDYTFDPAGNLVRLVDAAQEGPTAIVGGVSARRDYTYDAHYRVLTATGRIHQALLEHDYIPSTGTAKGTRHLSFNNAAAVERYTEVFAYDASGNLTSLRHAGTTQSWTTQMWISGTSNRSLPALDANGIAVADPEGQFDAAGNLRRFAHLRSMDWSWRGSLERAVLVERSGGVDDDESYVYSVDGARVRRVTTRVVTGDVVEVEEKVYFGGCERKRIRRGSNVLLERWTSMIGDGTRRIAVIHRWTSDVAARETDDVSRAHVRYQLATHQGSSALELDQDGNLISYEEYLPLGGTAFLAGDNVRDVDLKEYRYSGKECDDATNLYSYGHRYYAPWLGRWLSPDPAGITDSYNLYQFVLGNPITFVDPNGLQTTDQTIEPEHHTYAVNSGIQIPAWARPVWDNLDAVQKLEIERGDKAIVRSKEGVLVVSAAENRRLIQENAGHDEELYLIGASEQEGDDDGGGGGDEPDVSDDQFTAGKVDFGEEGEIIVTGGGDGVIPVKATDGTSLKGGVTAGPSGKTSNPTTGTGSKRNVDPAKPSGDVGTGTGGSGSGTGSGMRGSGKGGMLGLGQSAEASGTDSGATSGVAGGTGGIGLGQQGNAFASSAGGSGNTTSAKPAGGGGHVANATPVSGASAGVNGIEGGLENGVEGGTGTHSVDATDARSTGGTGTSGTGTQAGGSSDAKLTPVTDANPSSKATQQGIDSKGSEHGSDKGTAGGRDGGQPDGSKHGSTQSKHTDGDRDGRPEGTGGGVPDGRSTREQDALDVITRIAGFANFDFDLPSGTGNGRGVPGGKGHHNLGWFGQFAYIALTILSFLGPGAVLKGFKGGAKVAGKGASFLTRMVAGGEAKIAAKVEEEVAEKTVLRFAHGTSPESVPSVLGGLSEEAAVANTKGGTALAKGSFFAHEIGPPGAPGEGLSLAYQWGIRHSPTPSVVIGELPGAVANDLIENGSLQVLEIPGSGVTQLVFDPSSFARFNSNVRWIQVLNPR